MPEIPDMKVKISVLGSAGGPLDETICAKALEIGRLIAEHGCVLVTGACPGYPHQAAIGAKACGGIVVGISPALCWQEHVEKYRSPWREYDALVYTGSGLMGREVHVIRTSDIAVVIAGRSGTLGEFAIAYDEGKLIGVLQGTGGVADHVRDLIKFVNKNTGADVIFHEEPASLIEEALKLHKRRVAEGRAYIIPEHE
jgi:uncharacterized protein (TIGR00725 family)